MLTDDRGISRINLQDLDTGIKGSGPQDGLYLVIGQGREYPCIPGRLSLQGCLFLLKVQLFDGQGFVFLDCKSDHLFDCFTDNRSSLFHSLATGNAGNREIRHRVAIAVGLGNRQAVSVDIYPNNPQPGV
jgi:hypothetical protein